METKKTALYTWIIERFGEHNFERAKRINGNIMDDFESYHYFQMHQHATIQAFNDTSLDFFQEVTTFILHIELSPLAYLNALPASGFIFIKGKCFITNER